ncbi:nuclear transport factor 2 family protein [Maribellus mangrovi]|uniref:nuclear transport factor 2 family protein n=1 Tax=Maribellus mangrovi TaxID=3133146 RepID=UPI0030EEC1EC
MKKIVFLLILVMVSICLHAQKKTGAIYSEHELIEKTRQMWTAVTQKDVDKALSFFADNVYVSMNGQSYPQKMSGAILQNYVASWSRLPNLKIIDDTGAYPDALEYSGGDFWVQDWIRMVGLDENTGLVYNVPVHNLYLFKDGKIATISHYFDNSLFEEISNSYTTKENGAIYINHEYINVVRKLVNAYCSMNIDSVMSFYAPDAVFMTTENQWDESFGLEIYKKALEDLFADSEYIAMEQYGYPDCMHYEKNDNYTVYSWWTGHIKSKETGKVVNIPQMLSMQFNEDGKISMQINYWSNNHFE